MFRLFFIIINICSISIAIRDVARSSAGCPIFNNEEFNDDYERSPLFLRSRPPGDLVVGTEMNIELRPGHIVRASRHHIISNNVLRRFFNKLLERSDTNNDFRTFARALLHLCFHYPPDGIDASDMDALEGFIQGIINGLYNRRTHRSQFSAYQREVLIEALHAMYVWMPGNIFIGPRIRNDDPANGFESDAVRIVDPNNFRRLRELNSLMVAYIQDREALDDHGCIAPVNINRIVELIQNIDHVPTLFNNDDWVINPPGQLPVITWDDNPNHQLRVEALHPRPLRHLLYNDKTCKRPLVQKISTLPDRYCMLSPTKIGRKIIVALL